MESIKEVQITVAGFTERIYCERKSENIYYCLESPVFIELPIYGCEIEVQEREGKLEFINIVKESAFVLHKYLWSKEFLDSEKGKKIKEKIVEVGGTWEQVAGGFFYIYLPKEKNDLLRKILWIAE
jgi:hypothetical protein